MSRIARVAVRVAAGGLLGLAAAPASAQDEHGLSFVAAVGYETGGPGPSLVEQFQAADMGEDRPEKCAVIYCDPAVAYPFHFNEGIGITLMGGFRYRTRGFLSLEVLASNGVWGHAAGNSETREENLSIFYAPLVLSSDVGVHVGPIRVGLGPALNRTAWRATHNQSPDSRNSRSVTVGVVGSATLEMSVGRVAIGARVRARAFPDVDIPNPLFPLTGRYRSIVVALSVHPLPGPG